MATKDIVFTNNHIPKIQPGHYRIELKQEIKDIGGKDITTDNAFIARIEFVVQGERFSLNPKDIDSLYPPYGSLGDFSSVLPHIVLNRSTLPWERKVHEDADEAIPWMALLVFNEEDLAPVNPEGVQPTEKDKQLATAGYTFTMQQMQGATQQQKFKDIIKDNPVFASTSMNWPTLQPDVADDLTEPVTVIFPTRQVLEPLLAATSDLKLLAHVRHEEVSSGTTPPASDPAEQAVIIANRLPRGRADSIVHLVSLEHRYAWDDTKKEGKFDFRGAKSTDLIPLISLKTWRFSSLSARHNFRGAMLNLNHTPLFRLPAESTMAVRSSLEVGQPVPADLAAAFSLAEHPLDETAMISNQGKFVVYEKNHHYIVAQDGMLYTQNGVAFYKIKGFNRSWGPDPVLKRIEAAQADPEDALQFPKLGDLNMQAVSDNYWWIEQGQQRYFLDIEHDELVAHRLFTDRNPTLRLPDTRNDQANTYLEQGYVPLPHFLRQGSKTISWYRGPFATSPQHFHLDPAQLHVRSSDELLRFFTDTGTLDCSLAAAWELGRLLALRDKSFSVELEKWKRTHRRFIAQVVQQSHLPDLPQGNTQHIPYGNKNDIAAAVMPTALWTWFGQLLNLEAVPFNYLVPDERMLPAESVRFFYLDPNWLQSLFLGAFSLGRPLQPDQHGNPTQQPDKNGTTTPLHDTEKARTGFLMRSSIISGWPDLQIEATAGTERLPLTTRKLAKHLLLCLIEGEPDEVDFFLKPGQLHFGFHKNNPTATEYQKKFRNRIGEELDTYPKELDKEGNPSPNVTITGAMINYNTRVLNITDLKAKILSLDLGYGANLDSAGFALAMIEGAERFKWKKGG